MRLETALVSLAHSRFGYLFTDYEACISRRLSFLRIQPPAERAWLRLSLRVYFMARWGPGGGPPASAGPDIEGRGPPRDGPIALETPAADSRRAKTRRLFAELYCPRALLRARPAPCTTKCLLERALMARLAVSFHTCTQGLVREMANFRSVRCSSARNASPGLRPSVSDLHVTACLFIQSVCQLAMPMVVLPTENRIKLTS